mgnify:CR=1 FL=1
MSFHQFTLFQTAEDRFGHFYNLQEKDHIMWLFDFVQCYVHLKPGVVDNNKKDIAKGYLKKKPWEAAYNPEENSKFFADLDVVLKEDGKHVTKWQVGEAVFNIPLLKRKVYKEALKAWNEERHNEPNLIKRIFNAENTQQTWKDVRSSVNYFYRGFMKFAQNTGIQNGSYFLRPYTFTDGDNYFYDDTVQKKVCEEIEVTTTHAM